jgi:G3E family GTPase
MRVPITLVTGYLGAGKTTLLNAMLRDASAGRIAVVINEFGDVGLDHDLIVETTEETVLLASGCMCCTVRGDLVQAMETLLSKRARGLLAFDRIVLETTGLADPAPILHTLIVSPNLGKVLRLDGVVTVCDAVNGMATLDAGFEAVSQVAMADVIVVSKSDLVTDSALGAFTARLGQLAPGARVLTAAKGQLPISALFGAGPPPPETGEEGALAWVNAPAYGQAPVTRVLPQAAMPGFGQPLGQSHGLFGASTAAPAVIPPVPAARHDDRIASVSAVFDDPIHPVMLDIWLETLLGSVGAQVLRLKVVLWAEGFDAPFVLHGVQHIMDPPVQLTGWTGKDRKSRIVLIGRDLSSSALWDSLAVLRTKPQVQNLG